MKLNIRRESVGVNVNVYIWDIDDRPSMPACIRCVFVWVWWLETPFYFTCDICLLVYSASIKCKISFIFTIVFFIFNIIRFILFFFFILVCLFYSVTLQLRLFSGKDNEFGITNEFRGKRIFPFGLKCWNICKQIQTREILREFLFSPIKSHDCNPNASIVCDDFRSLPVSIMIVHSKFYVNCVRRVSSV